MVERQSCKLKVLGSIPGGGSCFVGWCAEEFLFTESCYVSEEGVGFLVKHPRNTNALRDSRLLP